MFIEAFQNNLSPICIILDVNSVSYCLMAYKPYILRVINKKTSKTHANTT